MHRLLDERVFQTGTMMGFLDWLFGRCAREQSDKAVWRRSDQGNSTAIVVRDRIATKQALRLPKKPPISAKALSDELKSKIDNLIAMFNDAPLLSEAEQERIRKIAFKQISRRMIDEGVTYGGASDGPAFLNQDEESFRTFLKRADQDLSWQCKTVAEAFERYQRTGETPAPHYPLRVAILLRKAKDHDRERGSELFLPLGADTSPSKVSAQPTEH